MSNLVAKIFDGFSHVPGLAWVIVVVTTVYVEATGLDLEKSWLRMLMVSLACVLMYCLASVSDILYKRLYDYDPKRKHGLPWLTTLEEARNTAANAFFGVNSDTEAYKEASASGYLSEDKSIPGLYVYAETLAKQADVWESKIKLLLELSKLSRTLSLAALLTAVAIWFGWIRVAAMFSRDWILPNLLLIVAGLLLIFGFLLRAWHQIALYKCMATRVERIMLANGRQLLVSTINLIPAPNSAASAVSSIPLADTATKK